MIYQRIASNVRQEEVVRLPNEASSFSCLLIAGAIRRRARMADGGNKRNWKGKLMSYNGAKDGKHYWLTPPELMKQLNDEFHFDFDPCPYPRPEGFDGLEVEWGQRNYVNPPFNGPTKWVRKAIAEYQKGKLMVFVFPIDKWVHLFLHEVGGNVRNLGDIKWCSIEDGKPGKGTGRHIACFILDPEKKARRATEGAAV